MLHFQVNNFVFRDVRDVIDTAIENVVDDAEKTTHWHRDQFYRVPAEGCTDADCDPLLIRFDQRVQGL